MNKYFNPDLLKYSECEKEILLAKLKALRATVKHPSEKGKSIEYEIMEYLRGILPNEYGLSTGFIAYHNESCIKGKKYVKENDKINISTQLDIIIYDALRYGPIIKLGSCDIFPLEAVYGYVEVKTSISKLAELKKILNQSKNIRKLKTKFYIRPKPNESNESEIIFFDKNKVISIRSFIFILDAKISSINTPEKMLKRLNNINKEINGFISGMYIMNLGYYRSDYNKKGLINIEKNKDSLVAFKNGLYTALSRYPRIPKEWTPALDMYYNNPDGTIEKTTLGSA